MAWVIVGFYSDCNYPFTTVWLASMHPHTTRIFIHTPPAYYTHTTHTLIHTPHTLIHTPHTSHTHITHVGDSQPPPLPTKPSKWKSSGAVKR